jgi:hypothetical protein
LRANSTDITFQHVTSSSNHAFVSGTVLDNPAINGNPDALILASQNFGTGVTNRASAHQVTVAYQSVLQRWLLLNVDGAAMADGLMFNNLVIPPKRGFMLVTARNTGDDMVQIDNPDVNGNPNARLYVTHNWNPPESDNENPDDHPIGVFYSVADQHWNLYNRDLQPILAGTTFNVFYTWPRINSFPVSASAADTTTATSMYINHPLLNQTPDAVAIGSFTQDVNGVFGADYTSQVGLRMFSNLWRLFNNGGPNFPAGLSYNVLVPPADSSFVVTAATGGGGNVIGNDLIIDNPLTNNDPYAMLFVTPRDNGGIDEHNIGVFYALSKSRWGIFNEGFDNILNGQMFNVFVIKRHYLYLPSVRK